MLFWLISKRNSSVWRSALTSIISFCPMFLSLTLPRRYLPLFSGATKTVIRAAPTAWKCSIYNLETRSILPDHRSCQTTGKSSHLTQRSRAECLVALVMSHQRSIRGQKLFQGILFGDDDSTVREHSMSAADLSNFKSALRTKMNDSLLKRINDVEGIDILLFSLFL